MRRRQREKEREELRKTKVKGREDEELGRARARWAKGAALDGEGRRVREGRKGRVWENV